MSSFCVALTSSMWLMLVVPSWFSWFIGNLYSECGVTALGERGQICHAGWLLILRWTTLDRYECHIHLLAYVRTVG